MQCFSEFPAVAIAPALKKSFRSAPQVSGTHRGSERQAVNPPECLDLKCADERDQRVDDEVGFSVRNEDYRQQTENFQQEHGLMP